MTKTQQLIAAVNAGTHRIDAQSIVYRRITTGEWVRSIMWRIDVARRAELQMRRAAV